MDGRGLTSDEARARIAEHRTSKRWILCVDCNYYVHRFWHSGSGVAAGSEVAGWVRRTVRRLREKGLTDAAACFDSKINHRKELTAQESWTGAKYKDRPPKDPELVRQIETASDLLTKSGIATVAVSEFEADDVMASYAHQFKGKITLLSADKDLRQLLSRKCNILLDVEWDDNDLTGKKEPIYKWLSAKQHTEETGITPKQWTQFQALMGDNCDGIKGCPGIGEKGAKDLIQQYGTAAAAIEWAKAEAPSITPKKREALIEFESQLETTLKLVTLRTDLPLQTATRLT